MTTPMPPAQPPQQPTVPAGWYDDGSGTGTLRYWDGAAWTQHVAGGAAAYGGTAAYGTAAYGAAAYGGGAATTGAAPAKRRRRVWPWLVPLIVVVVAGIGVGVWALFSLLGSAVAGPRDAVVAFNDAYDSGDCDAVYADLTPEYGPEFIPTCDDLQATLDENAWQNYTVRVTSVNVENDEATVETRESWTDSMNGTGSTVGTYELVNADGRWLIDQITYSNTQ